jgi:hypothetical protein
MIFVSGMVVYYLGSVSFERGHDVLGESLTLFGGGLMGTSVILLLAGLMP